MFSPTGSANAHGYGRYTVVLPGATIGDDVNVCSHCFIENDVEVGDRVTIKSGVQLWDGIRIGNDVFIGPNVTFTNDKFPRSKAYPEKFLETRIEDGSSIGGGGCHSAGRHGWARGRWSVRAQS